MTLRLVREPTTDGATMGVLFIDGHFQCFTLEDEIREVAGQPVSAWKVKGATAIPAGRYTVDLTYSGRFNRLMPILLDVPGFSGIRLHTGNTAADTEGCPLVGRTRGPAQVGESRLAFQELWPRLVEALDDGIVIDVQNPEA